MAQVKLADDKWQKIFAFLQDYPRIHTANEARVRRFVEAVLWMARSGAAWRFLPESYGDWNKVYKRYARWCELEVWVKMHQHFAQDPDMENVLIDSTAVRAHPCAAGAAAQKGGPARRRWAAVAAVTAPKCMPPQTAWATPCALS
jgi:transposase